MKHAPEYPKIQTMFMREPTGRRKIQEDAWSRPEFEYLKDADWLYTEKVDGMNIRVHWDGEQVRYYGRTDRAMLPPQLRERLVDDFDASRLGGVFPGGAVLYGEGYGAKIQKGGANYSDTQQFVLFDVMAGGLWLEWEDVKDVAKKLRCRHVPEWGVQTLERIAEICQRRPNSTWGEFCIEGFVARPLVGLQDRRGNRIATKIKCADFG